MPGRSHHGLKRRVALDIRAPSRGFGHDADAVNCGKGRRHTLDDGHNSPLLNGRRTLKTVGVNTCIVRLDEARVEGGSTPARRRAGKHTSEELRLEVHVVERIDGLIVVRLDLP